MRDWPLAKEPNKSRQAKLLLNNILFLWPFHAIKEVLLGE
jgi:hypothetical protein